MKNKNKKFVLGSNNKIQENSYCKKCVKCKKKIWFNDDWDWNKLDPICINCVEKSNVNFFITQETIDKLKDLLDKQVKEKIKYIG